eukprot:1610580-Pyramimonas_sp.AAC.1
MLVKSIAAKDTPKDQETMPELSISGTQHQKQNRRGSVAWGKEEQFEGNKVGKHVYKESENYDLMLNLKVGIQCCVSTVSLDPL